jgi:hypothetical protein
VIRTRASGRIQIRLEIDRFMVRKSFINIWGIWGASLLVLAAPVTAANSGFLTSPSQVATLDRDFSGSSPPLWSNGAFLAHDQDQTKAPALLAFDRTGRQLLQVPITFPDAAIVNLVGLARSPDGAIAVSGTAASLSGEGANFIAWVTSAGVISKVTRTTPFAPIKLAYAEDGTLWALGRIINRTTSHRISGETLRHYDRDGKLLGSSLPAETFPSPHGRHPAVDAFLAVNHGHVVVFSATAEECVELSSSGEILKRSAMPPFPDQSMITGMAVTAEGLYISVQPPGQTLPRGQIYKFDRVAPGWQAIDSSRMSDAHGNAIVLGSDDDHLVIGIQLPSVIWTRED